MTGGMSTSKEEIASWRVKRERDSARLVPKFRRHPHGLIAHWPPGAATRRGNCHKPCKKLWQRSRWEKQEGKEPRRMLSGDLIYFVHCLPRRTRLKVPQRRRDHAFFAELKRRLSALSGVESVSVTPETASVVVHHTPDFRWSTVRLEAMGLHPVAQHSERAEAGLQRGIELGGPSLASAILWIFKAVWSGRVIAHVVELIASALIQHALDDLLRTKPARI